jgi:hypothetical protein
VIPTALTRREGIAGGLIGLLVGDALGISVARLTGQEG